MAVAITGAGRTDQGVHALGQAASFSLDKWKSEISLLGRALNAKMPGDVSVTGVREVRAGFNARRDAVSRSYRYSFLLSPVRSPLRERFAYRIEQKPDYPAMLKAAAIFRGTHDFSAFSRGSDGDNWPRRTVSLCALTRSGRYIFMDVEAGGFLRHMVRHMAAAVMGVGLGYLQIGAIRKSLTGGVRRAPAVMLPPHGLSLTQVEYKAGINSKVTRPGIDEIISS